MATRWSRLHGEPYLRRKRGYGEVEDVGGGSWWCCGSEESDNGARLRWIWLGGGHGFPVAALAWKKMAESELAR